MEVKEIKQVFEQDLTIVCERSKGIFPLLLRWNKFMGLYRERIAHYSFSWNMAGSVASSPKHGARQLVG